MDEAGELVRPAKGRRIEETYRIGDHVRVENRPSGDEWVIVSNRGKMFAASDLKHAGEKGKMRRVIYGTRHPGETWVLQRRNAATRNPVWTDPERNKCGEGETEQRHCVVTRSDENVYRFWFFADMEDEIACIERSSKRPIHDLLCCENRGCDRPAGAVRTNEVGYVCYMSDYIYFSGDGLRVRERAAANQLQSQVPSGSVFVAPLYTRDFARYAALPSGPGVNFLEPVPQPVLEPVPQMPADEGGCVDVIARLVDAIRGMQPRVALEELQEFVSAPVFDALCRAYRGPV